MITSFDIDLSGGLQAGTMAISIHGSQSSQTIGLGTTPKDMTITGSELQRISSSGTLTIGSSFSSAPVENGLTSANKQYIGVLSLFVLTSTPTAVPTAAPTAAPTGTPTSTPTVAPTPAPTVERSTVTQGVVMDSISTVESYCCETKKVFELGYSMELGIGDGTQVKPGLNLKTSP